MGCRIARFPSWIVWYVLSFSGEKSWSQLPLIQGKLMRQLLVSDEKFRPYLLLYGEKL